MTAVNRWREPVAWVALAVGVGYLLLTIVWLLRYMSIGHLSFPGAANALGGGSLPIPMVLVLVAAALACALVKPPTPKAAQVLRAASVVIGVGALAELVFLVIGFFDPVGNDAFGIVLETVGAALSISIKVAGAWVLHRVSRGLPAAAPVATLPSAPTPPPATVAPAWRPEDAVGAVWNRAGDAATGAQGNRQQAPAPSGWQPRPQPSAGAGGSRWQPPAPPQQIGVPNPAPAGPPPRTTSWATAGDIAQGRVVPRPDVDEEPDDDHTIMRPPPQWRPADPQ